MADQPQEQAGVRARIVQIISGLRPAIQADGGDIEFVDLDDNGVVSVRLHGACVGCPGARMTLKMGVERFLKEKVPQVCEVVCI